MKSFWRAAVLVAVGAIWCLIQGAVAAGAEEPEVRAFWVDAFHAGFKTQEDVDRLIDDAARANINTLIVQVRRRGDAYYNLGSLEPRSADPALRPGFDPLAYVIDRAHSRGIEVHAWLATLAVGDNPAPPKDPNYVWNLHGPSATGADNWVSYRLTRDTAKGVWSQEASPSQFLDPGNPAALDYTVEVYLDVIRNYAVDGVHLDLCRYAGPEYGYNPTSLARYNARYGTEGRPEPDDPRWSDWRREQVTNLVRKVYLKAIALRPGIKVSAATIAWGQGPVAEGDWVESRGYSDVFQDWQGWLREGVIDLAMPMNYDRERDATQRLWYDQWLEWEKDHQYGRQIVIGPGIYENRIEESLAQIRRAQAPSGAGNRTAGVALYSYASTSGDATSGLIKANAWFYTLLSAAGAYTDPRSGARISTQPVFPTPVPVPDMPWKSHPDRGFLMGSVQGAAEHLKVIIAGPETREVYTDGSGWFGTADLVPGEYQISVGANGPSESPVATATLPLTARVTPGQVSEVKVVVSGTRACPCLCPMCLGG